MYRLQFGHRSPQGEKDKQLTVLQKDCPESRVDAHKIYKCFEITPLRIDYTSPPRIFRDHSTARSGKHSNYNKVRRLKFLDPAMAYARQNKRQAKVFYWGHR